MLFLREGRLFRSVSFDFVFRLYFRAGCDILTVIAFILDRAAYMQSWFMHVLRDRRCHPALFHNKFSMVPCKLLVR